MRKFEEIPPSVKAYVRWNWDHRQDDLEELWKELVTCEDDRVVPSVTEIEEMGRAWMQKRLAPHPDSRFGFYAELAYERRRFKESQDRLIQNRHPMVDTYFSHVYRMTRP